jgi:hypothetical protein
LAATVRWSTERPALSWFFQDGPDHVESHRGTAFVVGPYVKKDAVISTRYS